MYQSPPSNADRSCQTEKILRILNDPRGKESWGKNSLELTDEQPIFFDHVHIGSCFQSGLFEYDWNNFVIARGEC